MLCCFGRYYDRYQLKWQHVAFTYVIWRHFQSAVLVFHVSIVFGVEPDLTREGGSIPVTLTFQEATGRNVMLLPVGSSDDGAHSQNEKINR